MAPDRQERSAALVDVKKFRVRLNMTRALSFPKSRRLTRSSDFERMKKEGRSQRGPSLILSVLPVQEPVVPARPGGSASRMDRNSLRAGFVTSKRIGSAVVRNRVRRRLREIVRKHQPDLPGNFWIVTIARPKAARATYRELEDEWLRLAKRASILAA
jgi:ribonuclease P protein component